MKVSVINAYSPMGLKNNALKNNAQQNNMQKNERNSAPAFKGHSEESLVYGYYNNITFDILGKRIENSLGRYSTMQRDSAPSEIANYLADSVKKYNRETDRNRYFDKTANKTETKLYIADPNEKITEEIRKNHGYIVYDNEPPFPTFEQLEHKYTSSSKDTHNYFKDVTDYIAYQNRVIETEKKNIEKAKKFIDSFPNNNETLKNVCKEPSHTYPERYRTALREEEIKTKEEEKNITIYKKRMNQARLKAGYAQNVYNLLCKNGDDFVERDKLCEKVNNPYIDSPYKEELKTLERYKYLTDEEIHKLKEQIAKFEQQGGTISHELMSKKNALYQLERKSSELQNKYDYYLEKSKPYASTDEAKKALYNLLNKMAKDYVVLKKYFSENNLDLL